MLSLRAEEDGSVTLVATEPMPAGIVLPTSPRSLEMDGVWTGGVGDIAALVFGPDGRVDVIAPGGVTTHSTYTSVANDVTIGGGLLTVWLREDGCLDSGDPTIGVFCRQAGS